MTNADLPAFEPTSIELQSVADSKITSVSVYPTRAEVTRVYKFAVHTGQNQVYISGLPNVLEPESLRVEGRGAATIHDVTLSMEDERVPKSSAKLEELLTTREDRGDALARCEQALSSLRQYLGSLTVQNLPVTQLESVLHQYETTGARLDTRKKELTRELQRIDAEIAAERTQIAIPPEHNRLRNKAAIGVFAQTPGNVEIALIYGRAPRELDGNTGESWDNVPLQLETSTPTFGLGVPKLSPWNLDIYRPFPFAPTAPAAQVEIQLQLQVPPLQIKHEETTVTSTGSVNATFRVPGLVTIPCDGAAHNFTIVELRPQAVMSWVAVPKREAKTHLTAHITNASEYTLLSGTANVYVDGSFIARLHRPLGQPAGKLRLPARSGPSIRITYPPISKQLSQSGFYKKSATHGFTQRIMVHNTKSVPVDGLRIVDQIPASRNAQVKVKLVQPALPLGEGDAAGKGAAGAESNAGAETKGKKSASVSVSKGVVAQWDGGDDTERRVGWVCAVPAQGKINLTLEWTVTVSPADAHVVGL
ncbi:hypothetical protein B0H14DRAFT_3571580 [Mycena olivaceomarginata]|nr:hypothetical protein B0H14DRAFT_3571580 [Mycena olivaceomarginata]